MEARPQWKLSPCFCYLTWLVLVMVCRTVTQFSSVEIYLEKLDAEGLLGVHVLSGHQITL